MLELASIPRFPVREIRYTGASPSPLEAAYGGVLRAALRRCPISLTMTLQAAVP